MTAPETSGESKASMDRPAWSGYHVKINRLMNISKIASLAILCATAATPIRPLTARAADPALNQLTEEEKMDGWKLLFDGKTTHGWRAAKKTEFPAKGWDVQDGWLHCSGKGGGDIVSQTTYDQFELKWEWKQTEGGNSGVKYFVNESGNNAFGHEYQVIDDANNADAKQAEGKRVTASFYDVLKPVKHTPTKRAGEINNGRIVVTGKNVEHWLNGEKVLAYECGSDALKAAIAQSKFKNAKDFDARTKGPILLQDHQSEVWFRNVKIRDLSNQN